MGIQTDPCKVRMPQVMAQTELSVKKAPGQSESQTRRRKRRARKARKRPVDVNGNVTSNHELDWDTEYSQHTKHIGQQKENRQLGHHGTGEQVAAESKPRRPTDPSNIQTKPLPEPRCRRAPRHRLLKWLKKKKKKSSGVEEGRLLALFEPMRPLENEDWEEEIIESARPHYGWPYDFEDIINMATMMPSVAPLNTKPLLAPYIPSKHHATPIKWECKPPPPPVDGQFSDAEE